MKTTLFIVLLFAVLNVHAQTAETISELTPVSSSIGKFTKHVSISRDATFNYKISFKVIIEPVASPTGKRAVTVRIQTNTRELVFMNVGGLETARVSFYGRITSKDKKTDGFFKEDLTLQMEAEELANNPPKPLGLTKNFELPEGKYQIGIIVTDEMTGMRRVKIIKFQIP